MKSYRVWLKELKFGVQEVEVFLAQDVIKDREEMKQKIKELRKRSNDLGYWEIPDYCFKCNKKIIISSKENYCTDCLIDEVFGVEEEKP